MKNNEIIIDQETFKLLDKVLKSDGNEIKVLLSQLDVNPADFIEFIKKNYDFENDKEILSIIQEIEKVEKEENHFAKQESKKVKMLSINNSKIAQKINLSYLIFGGFLLIIAFFVLLDLKKICLITILVFVPGLYVFSYFFSKNIKGITNNLIFKVTEVKEFISSGKFDSRINENEVNPEFKEIAIGINTMLNSFNTPLDIAATYIERIAKGDIPNVIQDDLNVDFNNIKKNINGLINSTNQIIHKVKLIGSGDFTVEFTTRSEKDELVDSLNQMVRGTSNIISEFKLTCNDIAEASLKLSSISQMLSQGANEQASSSEEVSSSIEEMGSNIKQNVDNAMQTEKIAMNVANKCRKSNDLAHRSAISMKEVADKVSIIREIAFLTNILSLNGAIEAGRASEHGKGFEIVAAEVRKLAERFNLAIEEVNKIVKSVVDIANSIEQQLEILVPEVEKTTKFVQEISAASIEQETGIEQINNAMQLLNHVIQQNASTSEELATNSEKLASQAEILNEMISFFKIKGDNEKIVFKQAGKSFHENPFDYAKNKKRMKNIEISDKNKENDMNDDWYEKF